MFYGRHLAARGKVLPRDSLGLAAARAIIQTSWTIGDAYNARYFQVNGSEEINLSEKTIKSLAKELQAVLSHTDDIDKETMLLVKKLDKDIDSFIEDKENVNSPLLEDAIALEARFAASHPVTERIFRELIETLGRMGI